MTKHSCNYYCGFCFCYWWCWRCGCGCCCCCHPAWKCTSTCMHEHEQANKRLNDSTVVAPKMCPYDLFVCLSLSLLARKSTNRRRTFIEQKKKRKKKATLKSISRRSFAAKLWSKLPGREQINGQQLFPRNQHHLSTAGSPPPPLSPLPPHLLPHPPFLRPPLPPPTLTEESSALVNDWAKWTELRIKEEVTSRPTTIVDWNGTNSGGS